MALPKLTTPTYELEVPSTDEKLKYRPFLVKEEKILLMAMESGENKDIIQAVKDIVSHCTFDKLNLGTMPMFDVEYIFLNIRAKSVGEVSKLNLLCPDDKKTYVDIELDLSKIEVQVDDKHTNNIVIDEDKKIGMILKYPTLNSVDPNTDFSKGVKTDVLFDIIGNSVFQIYEGEKVYNASDYKKDELDKFIESLDSKTFVKVQDFYNTMPKLIHEVEVENPKTKVKSNVTLQGLTDFFG